MALSSGTRLGPYEILALIGVGGTGEVYRARDTRLNRIVAIKLVPQIGTIDPGLRQRVEQEARIVAGMSHPHICALYDIGREGQIDYFVMEFLEGETLSRRMERGPLPLELILRYGVEMAAALAAAHRHAVVHCDLTPSNIMLTHEGVKLLDFGIAQLRAEGPGPLAATLTPDSPTAEATPSLRSLLGTLHYMAPEQVRGGPVDTRTDIFALGAVLYQMVAGRRPFEGATNACVIAAILECDPPSLDGMLGRPVAAALDHLIGTCLAKDPEDRWQSAQDVERELSYIAARHARTRTPPATRWARLRHLMLAGGAAAAAALLVASVFWHPSAAVTAHLPPRVQFDIEPAPPAVLSVERAELSVSPDGQHVAFIARRRGRSSLWVRSFGAAQARELTGTEDAAQPFWSPDSRSIGFHASGLLKRAALTGDAVQNLCAVPRMAGATWSPRGEIVFSELHALRRVPEHGGTPAVLPHLPVLEGDAVVLWPQFLPGGARFLFRVARGPKAAQGIYAGSLERPPHQRVLETRGNVVPAGRYLLSIHADSLMAQGFEPARLVASGKPVPVAEGVMENLGELAGPSMSASETGVLAFRPRHAFQTTLTWFDRDGRPLDTLDQAPAGCRNPEISPGGLQVAVECPSVAGRRDIWVLDPQSREAAPLTSHGADDSDPLWSPDGRWVVFSSDRSADRFSTQGAGTRDLYRRSSAGSGPDELLLRTPRTKYPNSWSRAAGGVILFTSRDPSSGWDIWMLAADGTSEPLVRTPAAEIEPQLSPDGRWLAYTSDESGRNQVFVRPFPGTSRALLISPGGGSDPRWRDDGTELYYLSPDRALMVVGISRTSRLRVSAPRPLFQTRTSGPLGLGVRFNYAVGPGGRRFLVTADAPGAEPSAIRVVLNWDGGALGGRR